MFRTSRIVQSLVLSLTLSATACGAGAAGDPVTVFAAASLTEAFEDLGAGLSSSGLAVAYSFGGSGSLVAQIAQGAPADVVATADRATMDRLIGAGLVQAPLVFARNRLELLVAAGNPKMVVGLADLARPDVKVVLADDGVPAGRYAAQAFVAAGVTVNPVSRETNVRSAVAKVARGEADATVGYLTDVAAGGARVQGIAIPPALNVVVEYLIAVVRGAKHPAGARAFVDGVVGQMGQDALARRGFLPAAQP